MDAAPIGLPLDEPRRLNTPSRETLLDRYRANESRSLMWLTLEVLAIGAAFVWWIQQPTSDPAWHAVLFFGVGALGLFDFALASLLTPRKRLEDIRPDARFGPHTRDSLLAAVRRVQAKLRVSDGGVRVYLAREKEVNAYAFRMELLPGCRLFNGVQLNRSILHLLTDAELESVIGHELGHLFPYSPLMTRCMLIHAVLSGMLSLVIAHLLSDYELRLGAPLLALAVVRWWAFTVAMSQIRLVEFLCDDHGARAAGLIPAMTAELKLGIENEARTTLLLRVLEAKQRHSDVPINDLMAEYEAALPWGGVDSEQARQQLERGIRQRVDKTNATSLLGFFEFLFKGDRTDEAALEEGIALMRTVRRLAKVPVDLAEVLRDPERLAECVSQIEAHPHRVLLHLEEEVDDRGSTHPNASRRLLYLWRNREAIARAS